MTTRQIDDETFYSAFRDPHSAFVSPNNIHCFWLYSLETVKIQVIHKVGNLVFLGQFILYHPSRFVFHSEDERLIERKRELVVLPDNLQICIIEIHPFPDDSFCFTLMTGEIAFRLDQRLNKTFYHVRVVVYPAGGTDEIPI